MTDIYQAVLYGFSEIISWMESIEYNGINLLMVSFFAFFFTLIWQLILAPVLGNRSGSLSIGLSDVVRKVKNNKDEK